MNPSLLLRIAAGKLRHAEILDQTIDYTGRVLEERSHHYLTCKRCELERKAFEIEEFYRDFVKA